MYTLVIDTATERAVTALFTNDLLLGEKQFPPGLQSSTLLLPAITNLLQDARLTVNDLGLIIVGVGPGSYTGIRVGVAAAKALSFPTKIPLVGVSSLLAMDPEADGDYLALIDARVSGAYYLSGLREQGRLLKQTQPAIASIDELATLIQEGTLLVTPAAARLQQRLSAAGLPDSFTWIEAAPQPRLLLALGKQLFESGSYNTKGEVDILYLRKTQAEIERDQKS